MKKLLFLIASVSILLAGCSKQEDMSSPPATSGSSTNAASSGTSTNQ